MRIIRDFIDFQKFIKNTKNNSYISIVNTIYWTSFDSLSNKCNIILLENGDSLKQIFYIFDRKDSLNVYIPTHLEFINEFIILKFDFKDIYIVIDSTILSNFRLSN